MVFVLLVLGVLARLLLLELWRRPLIVSINPMIRAVDVGLVALLVLVGIHLCMNWMLRLPDWLMMFGG